MKSFVILFVSKIKIIKRRNEFFSVPFISAPTIMFYFNEPKTTRLMSKSNFI